VARQIEHFVSEPRGCAYLPSELASLEYRVLLDVDVHEWDALLERGWRRFGPAYFRPKCPDCDECVPLRVPVEPFRPSRNQRRVLARNEGLRIEIGVPRVDRARIELYDAWHAMQGGHRGWSHDAMTAERYFHEFAFPHGAAREIAYWDDAAEGGPRLVAVALTDETPRALSAVYTYHHPDYRERSLGTLSVLRQIELARRAGKRWLYLGFRVMGCGSSEYKARFRPHELLENWPGFDEAPIWRAPETPGRPRDPSRGLEVDAG
jgi:arginyl-tRNA--protein-N-Asp/Glu arginylyltransferase